MQRVSAAQVAVANEVVCAVGAGVVVLIGIERSDTPAAADRLLARLLHYRVFADDVGRMNRSLADTGGALLLVPQFTLAADTARGLRPGFSAAADPALARSLFDHLVRQARERHATVANGVFGADMQVSLTNDGPVTFWLQA